MAVLALLSDRSPDAVVPAAGLSFDVKHEPLTVESMAHVATLDVVAVAVDAVENPAQAWSLLLALRARDRRIPAIVIVDKPELERYPWEQVVDELLTPDASHAELRVRLAILRRRAGTGDGSVIRVGSLAIDTETYRVTASGRALDLTYKEFELLKFLAARSGRVFTRPALLREVWGYDFYGGTRTVDVHVRRLRAKLGPEHEHVIETVRGVGYRVMEHE
jgi:DNA-binding response OmpR family regulator